MARVELSVPRSLGPGGSEPIRLVVEAATVLEALQALARARPGLSSLVLTADGMPRRSIAVYVGGEDVRALDGAATRLADGDSIEVVPSMSGG